ncbi:MAG: hypothetical protein WAO98_02435, partial [Alphaproteobacteria bacterium]
MSSFWGFMKVALSRIFAGSRRATLRSAKAFSATFFLTLFATTQPAAAAISFGEVFCNVADNMSPFIQVFNLVAYVAAIFFIIQGLLHLKGYYDNPNQHPLHKSILLLSVGSVFTILPVTFKTLISTLFVTGSTGPSLGISSCAGLTTSTGATSAGGTVTLDAMLANFVGNIKEPLTFLISVVAITLGAFLIVRGLMKAAKYGQDARQHSMHNILTNLIIGTILVVFGQSVDMMMLSVLGVSASGGGLLSFSNLAW